MDGNPDFSDLLRNLSDARARYIVVGAYAVIYHAEPRYTKDLDIWIEPTPENATRVWQALIAFGAPLRSLRPADLLSPDAVLQIGVEPNRIDILSAVDGLTFDEAWKNRVRTSYAGVPLFVLGRADLIRAKKAAGRPQDLLDVRRLLQADKAKPPRNRRPPRRRK